MFKKIGVITNAFKNKIVKFPFYIEAIVLYYLVVAVFFNIAEEFSFIVYIVFFAIVIIVITFVIVRRYKFYFALNENRHELEYTFLSDWKNESGILITNQSTTFSITLNDERALIKWLRNKVSEINELRSLSAQEGWMIYIDSQLEMFEDAIKGCNARDYKAVNALGTEIEDNHILLPESPIGFYVFDKEKDPLKRFYAYAFLSDVDFSNLEKTTVSEFEADDIKDLKLVAVREHMPFTHAVREWVIQEAIKTNGENGRNWPTDEGPKVISELAITTFSYAGRLRVQEQELKRLQSNLVSTLEQADRKLALRPAAKEWSTTATNSVILACLGLALFLGTFGLLLWGIYALGAHFMPIANDPEKLEKYIKIFAEAPIWSAAVITIPAILLAWLMKHFSRMFVQGFNMYSDARYRKALTQIYSEMGTRDGHKLTDDQKKIIFEAMFNPRRVTHTDENISLSPVDSIFKPFK